MSTTTIILILIAAVSYQSGTDCLCTKLEKGETTKTGWQHIILPERPPVSLLQGRVVDPNGEPLADAFVELFNQGKRVAGCKVGADGRFCFPAISSGKFELRVSQSGFDTVSMAVRVNRKIKKSENLEVALPVSN